MTLAPTFQFSQNSLQDYIDCPRRFQLRYLLRQPWPAVVSEPLAEFERLMEQGRLFHQLAQRHTVGLSVERLTQTIADDDLRRWWRNYLESPPPDLPAAVRRAEVTLSTPLAGYRLIARYDLIALEPARRPGSGEPGRAVIVDWKTGRSRPDTAQLAQALQTRVYRLVLVEAGASLNGGTPLEPEQVSMIYWFAEYPARPAVLPYSAEQYADDATRLTGLIEEIAARARTDEAVWPLTPNERHCRFCTYRSLCERHVPPIPVSDFDADRAIDLDLDFEEIEEIEY